MLKGVPENDEGDEDTRGPPLTMPVDLPAYCGHCAYDLRGLTARRCPECGGDLRAVGVYAERPRRRNVLGRCFLFLLMYVPCAALLNVLVVSVLPNAVKDDRDGFFVRRVGNAQVSASVHTRSAALVWPYGGEPDARVRAEVTFGITALGRWADDAEQAGAGGAGEPKDVLSLAGEQKKADPLLVDVPRDGGGDDAAAAMIAGRIRGFAGDGADAMASQLVAEALRPIARQARADIDEYPRNLDTSRVGGGGFGQIRPLSSEWSGTTYTTKTSSQKYPLARVIPPFAFVALGLVGLVAVASEIDLRPAFMRRRRAKVYKPTV